MRNRLLLVCAVLVGLVALAAVALADGERDYSQTLADRFDQADQYYNYQYDDDKDNRRMKLNKREREREWDQDEWWEPRIERYRRQQHYGPQGPSYYGGGYYPDSGWSFQYSQPGWSFGMGYGLPSWNYNQPNWNTSEPWWSDRQPRTTYRIFRPGFWGPAGEW